MNGNNLTYSYNDAGLVATGTDTDDVCYFENTYNELGRVISQVDGVDSSPTIFTYGENGVRTVTDRNGCQSTRVFNDNGLLISYTDEVGNTSTYEYDANCNLIRETDALGNSVTAIYNSFNKPTQITDKNGNITYYTYDTNGNITKITYPQNGESVVEETYAYNNRNQVTQHTDLRGTVIKTLMSDLKKVYGAVDEETALYELESFAAKWDAKYPKISVSWRAHWAELSTYFKYSQSVRTLIYTTNAIENFNRQLRKVTKSKAVFPNDDSLLKMLYLAQMDITRKWTGRRRDWGEIHSQLEIFFADRLPQ